MATITFTRLSSGMVKIDNGGNILFQPADGVVIDPVPSNDILNIKFPDGSSLALKTTDTITNNGSLITGTAAAIAEVLATTTFFKVAGSSLLPINSTLGLLGDSIVSHGYFVSGANTFMSTYGFTTWAQQVANFKFFTPINANAGVSGNTTTQMLARLGAFLNIGFKVVIFMGGTNDIAGSTTAAITLNLSHIFKAIVGSGAKLIVVTVLPRYSPNALTAPQEVIRLAVNAWILTQASNDIIVVDAESTMSSAVYYGDGLHPNSLGAGVLGALVGAKLAALLAPTTALVTDNLGTDTNYTTNGTLLIGTAGTKDSGTTGTVVTSFDLRKVNAGGAAVAGSITNTNGLNQQQIDISGTYTSDAPYVTLYGANSAATGLGMGDVMEGLLDFEVLAAMTNVALIYVIFKVNNNAGSTLNAGYTIYTAGDNPTSPLGVGRYQVRTNPFVITSGVPNKTETYINIMLKDAGVSTIAVSASIKIHKVGLHILVSAGRRALSDVSTTMLSTDKKVYWATLTATRSYTLLAASAVPDMHVLLKDEAGTAGTNAITIVGTVNGSVNPTAINTNYGTYRLYSNGTAWFTE